MRAALHCPVLSVHFEHAYMFPSVYGRKIVCVWCEDFGALLQNKWLAAKHSLPEKPIVDLTNSALPTIIHTHTHVFVGSNPFDYFQHSLANKVYASPGFGI